MSDPFDELLAGLRGQRPPAPFAPAAAVRRRGRQRAHRQAVSVGVAVLAVSGLGAGGVVTTISALGPSPGVPGDGTPAASTGAPPTEMPSRTAVAGGPLLTAADLPGTGWREETGELLSGAWFWDGADPWCPEYRVEDYPSVRQRLEVDTVGWIRDAAAVPERVDQVVERFQAGVGMMNVDDVRAFIALCSRRPSPGDQVAPIYYEIEETGFAGDESLLVREEAYHFNADDEIEPAGKPRHVVVLRVGDAVTTIVFLELPDDVHTIAQRAAERLA